MSVGAFEMGCGCGCESCEHVNETFDRADSTSLGSDWTEVSNDWSISSNVLTVASNSSIAVWSTAITVDYYRVICDVRSTVNADELGVVGYYTDSSNFYSAELRPNSGTAVLRLYKTVAGSKTQLATVDLTAALSTYHELSLCITRAWDGGLRLTAKIGSQTAIAEVAEFTPSLSGPGKAGVIRSTATGTTTWDNFRVESTFEENEDCEECYRKCCCDEGTVPRQVQAVVTDFGSHGSCGATCAALNGTYTLDYIGGCAWATSFPDVVCVGGTFSEIRLTINCGVSTQLSINGPNNSIPRERISFTPVAASDCDTFDIADNNSSPGTSNLCDGFPAPHWSATVTAIP